MRFAIFRFIGTKDELKRKLAAMTGSNVIHLGRCELCSGLSRGPICRHCEPFFSAVDKENRPRVEGDQKF